MKKRNGLNLTATIVVVWVCIVVNYLLVRFEVPHAVAISVFLDTMVAIPMAALSSWHTKLQKICVGYCGVMVCVWWWAMITYIIYAIWGISVDTCIASTSVAIAVLLVAKTEKMEFIGGILSLPIYLVGLLIKRK